MKTISEIANDLGISKQRVYRFVKKNHISEAHHDAHQRNGVMHFDDVAEKAIIKHFSNSTTSSEVHHEAYHDTHHDTVNDTVINMLQKELEIKNNQISTLMNQMENMQVLLKQEQQTTSKLIGENQKLLEQKQTPFINKIFKKKGTSL